MRASSGKSPHLAVWARQVSTWLLVGISASLSHCSVNVRNLSVPGQHRTAQMAHTNNDIRFIAL